MWQRCWFGISQNDLDIRSLYKYDVTPFHGNTSNVISNVGWTAATTGIAGCTAFSLYFVQNSDTWNETNVTWNNKPNFLPWGAAGNLIYNTTNNILLRNPIYATTDVQIDPSFVMSMYNSSNFTMAFISNQYSGCSANVGFSNYHYGNSREGTDSEILNATVTDFETGSFNYPRFSIFSPNFYWNFEAGAFNDQGTQSTGSSSNFPEAEFIYYTDQIDPTLGNHIVTKPGVTMTKLGCAGTSCTSPENDLINRDCANAVGYISAPSPIPAFLVNTDTGIYDTFCFNLTALHGGRPFYASLKVTSVDSSSFIYPSRHITAWWAMYGGGFSGFSVPVRDPFGTVVSSYVNITETWTTTQPMTTGYSYYEIDDNGVHGPTTNVQDTNFTTLHSFVIPASKVLPGGVYHVMFYGTTAGGSAIGSSYEDIFNVSAAGGVGGLQGDLYDITNPTNGGLGGLGVALFNERGAPTGGSVSLDGGPFQPTRYLACPNCSWVITFGDGTNYTVYPGYVFVTQFPPDIATVGMHTVRAKDFGGVRNRTYTFTIPFIPYNLPLRVLPSGCVPQDFEFSELTCQSDFIYNFTGMSPQPTGEFCSYNPTECQLYNYTDGTCQIYARHVCTGDLCAGQTRGGWVHYVCYNNVNSGYYNSTNGPGSIIPGTGGTGEQQGSVVPALTGPLEQILGMTTEQILAMLSLIISIAVGIFAGAKTKDGMVSVVVIVTMLFLFTIVTWLPFWVAFVLAIIAAFIVARFARGFLTGGGGH
jgi:hypothetical protein